MWPLVRLVGDRSKRLKHSCEPPLHRKPSDHPGLYSNGPSYDPPHVFRQGGWPTLDETDIDEAIGDLNNNKAPWFGWDHCSNTSWRHGNVVRFPITSVCCLSCGLFRYHYKAWRVSNMVVLRKPNKNNYIMVDAIILSKVLEKRWPGYTWRHNFRGTRGLLGARCGPLPLIHKIQESREVPPAMMIDVKRAFDHHTSTEPNVANWDQSTTLYCFCWVIVW